MADPKIPPYKPDPKTWEPVDARIRGKFDKEKPPATQAPAAKKGHEGGVKPSSQPTGRGYVEEPQPSPMERKLQESRPPPAKGATVFGERPVVFPLDAPVASPADPKLATPEELMARRDADGNPIPITFPITELATPAELAARKAGEAAKVAQAAAATKAAKAKKHKGPKVVVKLSQLPPASKARGLIAADVPARPAGISPEGFVEKPNIEKGHEFLFVKPDSGDKVSIKVGLFHNYPRMDPATRDRHVPEGAVLVRIEGKYLVVDTGDRETIRFLEERGGKVIVRH